MSQSVNRRKFVALGALVGSALAGATQFGKVARAQDATPAAGEMMEKVVCSEALGIGKAGDACVSIVHASPDAPAVDIYVDGAKAVEKLEFGKSTGYVALPSGDHKVQVTAAGGKPEEAVISADVTLDPDAAYEVLAVGKLAEIKPAIFPVDLKLAGDAEKSAVRVIHASPDAPAVDVALKGGDVVVPNLAFPDASAYLELPKGKYDLEVRPAGKTDVVLPLDGVEVPAGAVISAIAIGTLADKSLTVMLNVAAKAAAEAEATPAM